MHQIIRVGTLCAVLALMAWQQAPVQAEAKEGDWAGGWNTWEDAEKGDWAEYSLGGGITFKDEVTRVNAGKITYTHTLFANGKQTGQQEKTRDWMSIKIQVRMPYGKEKEVEWTEETLTLGEVELSCDKAKWTIGQATTEAYFCKDVPCGGVVKQVTNGKDIVWLTGFHSDKKGDGKTDKPDPVETVKSEMPRFYAAADNYVVLKITVPGRDQSYQLRKVGTVDVKSATWSAVACDEAGVPNEGAKSIDKTTDKEGWDKEYGKPSKTGVKLTVAAGEYVCDVYESKDEKAGTETSEWISEGALIKLVKKTKSGETVLEATKLVMK
ncbi:MAG: hypothetical protein KDB90_10695 [Planctomycetes bacterium]|nr:hypothetical protein [Planctomycetota bacterium]